LPYHDAFAPLTRQSIAALLDAAEVEHGVKTLDVACGPGDVAAGAAERGAKVAGIDFAPAMVDQASRLHPGIEFRAGDAEALPFEPGSFEAVVINFGVLHFADPDRAIAEAHRVLEKGGRLAFTVWAPPERAPGFAIVLNAIERHGRMDVGLPEGPPFFRFADRVECERTLIGVGFRGVRMHELPLLWRLPGADALFDAFWEGGVRTRGLLRAQTPGALAAIRIAIREGVAAHLAAHGATASNGGDIELPMPAVMTWGVKG
ncbi:MAG: methyltransferase domain-containing protein, partial [Candidatus Eisenbacteria bacterium]|nr:methyltransferase domain-containing protein [Candidatus Eisenbacteria bacterium]